MSRFYKQTSTSSFIAFILSVILLIDFSSLERPINISRTRDFPIAQEAQDVEFRSRAMMTLQGPGRIARRLSNVRGGVVWFLNKYGVRLAGCNVNFMLSYNELSCIKCEWNGFFLLKSMVYSVYTFKIILERHRNLLCKTATVVNYTSEQTCLLISKIGSATATAPVFMVWTTDLSDTIRKISCHCSADKVTRVLGSCVRIITFSLVDLLFWGGVSLSITSNESSRPFT